MEYFPGFLDGHPFPAVSRGPGSRNQLSFLYGTPSLPGTLKDFLRMVSAMARRHFLGTPQTDIPQPLGHGPRPTTVKPLLLA